MRAKFLAACPLLGAALSLLLAGCGGATSTSGPAPTPAAAASPPAGTGASAGAGASAKAENTAAFAPKPSITITETARAVVNAEDRSEADRKLDAGRHPAELLSFFGIHPGMRVAEIGAGMGYTTELLARAVAPN